MYSAMASLDGYVANQRGNFDRPAPETDILAAS